MITKYVTKEDFPQSIFNLQLVESVDAQPADRGPIVLPPSQTLQAIITGEYIKPNIFDITSCLAYWQQ